MEVDGKVAVILKSILWCHGSQTSPVKIYLFYWVNTISWLLVKWVKMLYTLCTLMFDMLFYFYFQNIPNHLKSDCQSSNKYYHRHYNVQYNPTMSFYWAIHTYFIKHSCIKYFFYPSLVESFFFLQSNITPWSCDLPKEWHRGQ